MNGNNSNLSLRQEVDEINLAKFRNESPLDPVIYADEESFTSLSSSPSLSSSNSPSRLVNQFISPLNGNKEHFTDLSCSLKNILAILARGLFESAIVSIYICLIPASLVFLFTSSEPYNILTKRWNLTDFEFNPVMEFIRITLYTAGMYSLWVNIDSLTKIIPLIIRRSWHLIHVPLPNAVKTTLSGWRSSRGAINTTLFGCIGLVFTDLLLFGSSKLVSSATELTSTTISGLANSLDWLEKILVALTTLSLMILGKKILMQLIITAYRKRALAPRILASNFKFYVLNRLFRQSNLGEIDARRSIVRENARESLHPSNEDCIQISKDLAGLHLTSEERAEEIASALWARICPLDRDYLVQEDLQAFFTLKDVPEAYQVFDSNNTGIINSANWTDAIVAIWKERCNLQSSVFMSDQTLGNLENIFSFFILLAWTFSFLSVVSKVGYNFLAGAGGFILGFGYLFKDTCQTVWKSFIFVIFEHPFDIGDNVIIDNIRYTVLEMRLFQTAFKRQSDSTITYISNESLANKYIYNERRSQIVIESLLVTLPSSITLTALGSLQASLTTFLGQKFASFTGSILIKTLEVQHGKMNIRVECRFRDHSTIEKEVRIARKDLVSNRIQSYLSDNNMLK